MGKGRYRSRRSKPPAKNERRGPSLVFYIALLLGLALLAWAGYHFATTPITSPP